MDSIEKAYLQIILEAQYETDIWKSRCRKRACDSGPVWLYIYRRQYDILFMVDITF